MCRRTVLICSSRLRIAINETGAINAWFELWRSCVVPKGPVVKAATLSLMAWCISFQRLLQLSITSILYLIVTVYRLLRLGKPPGHILVLADVDSKNLRLYENNIYNQCYFSKENNFRNAESDPKFGQSSMLVVPMPGKKGSGTLFRFASFWERAAGTALRRVPSQKYRCL
jgi:hypothetical protein